MQTNLTAVTPTLVATFTAIRDAAEAARDTAEAARDVAADISGIAIDDDIVVLLVKPGVVGPKTKVALYNATPRVLNLPMGLFAKSQPRPATNDAGSPLTATIRPLAVGPDQTGVNGTGTLNAYWIDTGDSSVVGSRDSIGPHHRRTARRT